MDVLKTIITVSLIFFPAIIKSEQNIQEYSNNINQKKNEINKEQQRARKLLDEFVREIDVSCQQEITCNFEVSECGFEQGKDDKLRWTRHRGMTSFSGKGPSFDHTTGNKAGYYMYIEASSPHQPGDEAKLYSPPLKFFGAMCLEFYYYMSSAATGSLNVTINETVVFSSSGDKVDTWHKASINISSIVGLHWVTFEAVVESNITGDIAIDDFSFTEGSCPYDFAKSCKDIQEKRQDAPSGAYWIQPDGDNPFQVYCDQETDGGGWTLVYSYTFTNFKSFMSGSNAVTPRPNWPISSIYGNINISTTPPVSETDYNAMNFNYWKNLGREFMVKSNINHWISCKEQGGSLVEFKGGNIQCRNIKNVPSKCRNYVPDEIQFLAAGNPPGSTVGPYLYRSQSSTLLKDYYYFEGSTKTGNWPTHDPCGTNSDKNHLTNVANPHGTIYIRK